MIAENVPMLTISKIIEENLLFITINLKNVHIGIFIIKSSQFRRLTVPPAWNVISVMVGWNTAIILWSTSKKVRKDHWVKSKKFSRKSWQTHQRKRRKEKVRLRAILIRRLSQIKVLMVLVLLSSRMKNLQKENFLKEVIRLNQKQEIKAITVAKNNLIWVYQAEKVSWLLLILLKRSLLFTLTKKTNCGSVRAQETWKKGIQMEDRNLKEIQLKKIPHILTQ